MCVVHLPREVVTKVMGNLTCNGNAPPPCALPRLRAARVAKPRPAGEPDTLADSDTADPERPRERSHELITLDEVKRQALHNTRATTHTFTSWLLR
jgi:hypothetical protein